MSNKVNETVLQYAGIAEGSSKFLIGRGFYNNNHDDRFRRSSNIMDIISAI
jgi:hypothetical protein